MGHHDCDNCTKTGSQVISIDTGGIVFQIFLFFNFIPSQTKFEGGISDRGVIIWLLG